MNESRKVQSHHLARDAYLYIRQSSMKQVVENVESTKRQYALRGRATALGWPDDRIVVIDSDQGESGASAARREGFRQLVTDVGLGRAGIVMGLEVSRLARNNADWHRLLEICALASTLILDEDGVYDPANFNDRLLLGLKGTMSEAELHVLKARLRGGILNKVRRGEYRCVLPTGFVYDESGAVVLDPDAQVRETIAHFFDTFARVGSAHQTVKAFRDEGLRFPSRLRAPAAGVVFHPLTASAAMRTLCNPRYAGAYAYGQRVYGRTIDGKMTAKKRPSDDWLACIPNAHPGYISWDRYQENLRLLAANGHGYDVARASPPREGGALLQGRAICGRCGQYLRVRYREARGKLESWYVCDRATDSRAEPNCQSLAGPPIDEAVGLLVAEKMTPAAVELAIETRREIEARYEEADQLRCRAIERAQIDADLAQRRFMMVDPQNRLVADTLESDLEREAPHAPEGAGRARTRATRGRDHDRRRHPRSPRRDDDRLQGAVDRSIDGEPRAQANARPRGGGRDAREGARRRDHEDPCPLPRRAHHDAHDREPEGLVRDGEDARGDRSPCRPAARRPRLRRDRRDPQRARAPPRRGCVAGPRWEPILGEARPVRRAHLRPAAALRSPARPRAAHQEGAR
jgi:DNA invertase Pin-like site-specific DNA recombinase